MKKLFFLMVIATISTSAFAQIGVQAGATLGTVKDKSGSGSNSSDAKIGFTVGAFTEVPLTDNFVFRPALNFTQKGGKAEESSGTIKQEVKLTLNYIEIPMDFVYKAAGGFFVGAGPALAYGLSGKGKSIISGSTNPLIPNGTEEVDIEWGSTANSDEFKRFEFSGNLLAGYKLSNGIFISVNYNMGFSNLNNYDDESTKTSYIGIRIGKTFGGDKK